MNHNFDINIRKLISIYIPNGNFKKEEFRQFVLNKLKLILSKVEILVFEEGNREFWENLKRKIVLEKNEKALIGVNKILNLNKEIENWIKENVESEERLEFLILTKAAEINSTDKTADYYLAQLIRHDQLWAVVLVYSEFLEKLNKCRKMELGQILESEEWKFFEEKETEKIIFETAVRIYEMRK